ncbi:MarR family winged helix-turn-helix transcriptional regulator [Paenibacillus radicis (ex Gao et al. 2016)]|uniref:MarR family transcriptional regulator n=1 Tax=Paenibacillus radicis (ex Gao et al. 2016) TaxID=1737354 RepID=A0A917HEE2_9BACL|nr:MarR family transcriptional regulator [Paenibacillus radicis (ex Gao et al. 2016)]GGG75802.1 MarR family transcriptional regulator [Paenibacillus radicis (ex Gao et al. 2016)]
MKEAMSEEQQTALKLLVVLSKSFKSIMDVAVKDIKSYGLSSSEFAILEVLYAKGRIPIQQIGDRILITSGTMTYNIDKLENKGYLKRVPCSTDRRVTYAEITDVGRQLFDEIFPQHTERIETVMGSLTLEEQKQAIALLKALGKGAAGK